MSATSCIASLNPRPPLQADVTDPAIVEAAAWAVGHLRNLSDSGVYTSLSLAAILDAATQEGVYHNNTLLTLELASPHLLDGVPTSVHRVVVMADLEDGVRSFAIDAFPIMEPDAIEEFWTRKVDAHRCVVIVAGEGRRGGWRAEGRCRSGPRAGRVGDNVTHTHTHTSRPCLSPFLH